MNHFREDEGEGEDEDEDEEMWYYSNSENEDHNGLTMTEDEVVTHNNIIHQRDPMYQIVWKDIVIYLFAATHEDLLITNKQEKKWM